LRNPASEKEHLSPPPSPPPGGNPFTFNDSGSIGPAEGHPDIAMTLAPIRKGLYCIPIGMNPV